MPFVKPALTLFILVFMSTSIIGILYNITREPIAAQQAIRETYIINELLPGTYRIERKQIYGNPFVTEVVSGFTNDGELLGYGVVSAAPGYTEAVEIMTGFDINGMITGVRVLRQRETPGLGTAILNPSFLEQFIGRTETMAVVRMATEDNEIQALSSATISTNAVVTAINAALDFKQNINGR